MADQEFTPRAAFAGLADLAPGPASFARDAGVGVIATDRDGLGLATVALRKGQRESLTQCVRERYGIELPQGPHRAAARITAVNGAAAAGIAFIGTGPEVWLATQEKGGNDFAKSLEREIGGMASVSDQSDGYAVLRLAGPKLRDTLAKLILIDVHPRVFKPGDVASTVAAHVGATLWRLPDGPDGAPVFEIAVFRSLAASFWHALAESGAEFGLLELRALA